MSYYYTHFGDTAPSSDLSNANLATIYDPEDEIPTAEAAVALFQALGGVLVDGYGTGRTPSNPPEVSRKGVLVASTRDALHAAYYPIRTLVRQRSRLWRRRDSEVYSMGLDHWAIARCVSVSEGTVRRAGNAYHLPVSIKFQLISPCWYSTVLHGVEVNEWADVPTEFDEFTLDGGKLERAGDSVVVTNGGSIPCTDAIISVTAAAGSPVTAITLSANVCQITWTGTLEANKTLIINCGAKSVLNNYNPAYSGLSFGIQHHTHEWFILEPGVNTITATATTGGTNPDIRFSFSEPWE